MKLDVDRVAQPPPPFLRLYTYRPRLSSTPSLRPSAYHDTDQNSTLSTSISLCLSQYLRISKTPATLKLTRAPSAFFSGQGPYGSSLEQFARQKPGVLYLSIRGDKKDLNATRYHHLKHSAPLSPNRYPFALSQLYKATTLPSVTLKLHKEQPGNRSC
jgi:hypothetical protein